jgi:hypothetical protein
MLFDRGKYCGRIGALLGRNVKLKFRGTCRTAG